MEISSSVGSKFSPILEELDYLLINLYEGYYIQVFYLLFVSEEIQYGFRCYDCQGFGLKSCPTCGKGGLTPEQRGER